MPKRRSSPKNITTDINCPNCGEDLVFVLTESDGAPLVSPTCFRAYWPSELTREARLGGEPDLEDDRVLWSEVRRGRPDNPGKPADVQEYAMQRILERIR